MPNDYAIDNTNGQRIYFNGMTFDINNIETYDLNVITDTDNEIYATLNNTAVLEAVLTTEDYARLRGTYLEPYALVNAISRADIINRAVTDTNNVMWAITNAHIFSNMDMPRDEDKDVELDIENEILDSFLKEFTKSGDIDK